MAVLTIICAAAGASASLTHNGWYSGRLGMGSAGEKEVSSEISPSPTVNVNSFPSTFLTLESSATDLLPPSTSKPTGNREPAGSKTLSYDHALIVKTMPHGHMQTMEVTAVSDLIPVEQFPEVEFEGPMLPECRPKDIKQSNDHFCFPNDGDVTYIGHKYYATWDRNSIPKDETPNETVLYFLTATCMDSSFSSDNEPAIKPLLLDEVWPDDYYSVFEPDETWLLGGAPTNWTLILAPGGPEIFEDKQRIGPTITITREPTRSPDWQPSSETDTGGIDVGPPTQNDPETDDNNDYTAAIKNEQSRNAVGIAISAGFIGFIFTAALVGAIYTYQQRPSRVPMVENKVMAFKNWVSAKHIQIKNRKRAGYGQRQSWTQRVGGRENARENDGYELQDEYPRL